MNTIKCLMSDIESTAMIKPIVVVSDCPINRLPVK